MRLNGGGSSESITESCCQKICAPRTKSNFFSSLFATSSYLVICNAHHRRVVSEQAKRQPMEHS